jgi:hyaluronan-mediated motility receptor
MFEELASQSKTTAELKQQLEKMESLHELEMKENEEETDALMGEVETLRIRLQKQKKTMLKQEETIETLKESREESELEWKKRCKIMANRANQDMEKLKSMMGSKLENERVTYRKDMKRLTQKFEEKQRKTVVAMKSSQDTKLEKLTKQRNRSWEKEKQKLVHTLNRVLNEKNRLEREQEERANVETKLHEILEGFRTLKLGSGDEDSENQQLQYLRKELKKLQKENGFLSGHHNMQQRIRHVQKLKLENAELSQTVDALNDKISTLERKLEVATEMMENSIVPSKDKKWDRLAASHNRENDGVSMKWKKKSSSRKVKKKKRKVLGGLRQ